MSRIIWMAPYKQKQKFTVLITEMVIYRLLKLQDNTNPNYINIILTVNLDQWFPTCGKSTTRETQN